MTKNQIEYNKLLETQRANLASEEITKRRDEATRRLGIQQLQETARHNQQVELQARDNLAEQYRNNLAQLQELQRSHLVSEGIAQQNADATYRQAIETGRHNLATEELTGFATAVSKLGAELGASSRETAAAISAAASQYASDNALLGKQMDVDLGLRSIASQAGLRTAELQETKRINTARQQEINRANRAQEALKSGSLLETVRHNWVGERQSEKKISTDVSLRQEQNAISASQLALQRQKVNADISLIPSQKFGNYTRGLQSLASSASTLVNTFKKGKN